MRSQLGLTDIAKLELLETERRADIERTLSPAELREYDYRTSDTGMTLRSALDKFEATEAEFVALYPKVQAILLADIRDEGEAIDAILKQTLGDARYTQFQEINDRDLQYMQAFVASANLPPQKAYDVAAVQREFAVKRQEIQWNRDLSDNQRDQKRKELSTTEYDQLRPILGPHLDAYWQLHGNR